MYANVFLSTNDDVEHFKWYFELQTKRADGKPYIRVGVAQYWTFLPYPSKGLDLEEREGRVREKIERKHFVPMKLQLISSLLLLGCKGSGTTEGGIGDDANSVAFDGECVWINGEKYNKQFSSISEQKGQVSILKINLTFIQSSFFVNCYYNIFLTFSFIFFPLLFLRMRI